MLFILFEMVSDHKFDLDNEWNKGRKRKEENYISICKKIVPIYSLKSTKNPSRVRALHTCSKTSSVGASMV